VVVCVQAYVFFAVVGAAAGRRTSGSSCVLRRCSEPDSRTVTSCTYSFRFTSPTVLIYSGSKRAEPKLGPRGLVRLLRVEVPPSLRHSYFVGQHLLRHDYLHYVQRPFMVVRQSLFCEAATQTLRGSVLIAEGLATPAHFWRGFIQFDGLLAFRPGVPPTKHTYRFTRPNMITGLQ
jgi:hypothetical protein